MALVRILVILLTAIGLNAAQTERPYVVLVSVDGFRHDYASLHGAKNIEEVGHDGVAAKAMIPVFPTLTFPNHISLITGLYPAHHGIVANEFFNRAANDEYKLNRAADLGSWISGTPLWNLAEEQGLKAASMFWPASDAEIGGRRPTCFVPYDSKFPNQKRVEKVLEWLRLPAAERPHLLLTYFNDVDEAGHNFGPAAPETRNAVHEIDDLIGQLRKGIAATGLPVNLVIVSDHGMEDHRGEIILSDYADMTGFRVNASGPFALLYGPGPAAVEAAWESLHAKAKGRFDIYRRDQTPLGWHYRGNPRVGDLVIMALDDSTVRRVRPEKPDTHKGQHADDPAREPDMLAVFYAAGPNIRRGVQIGAFPNIDVYPFLAQILGLRPPPHIDGSLGPLKAVLR
jgi:alkaline phosphatase D